MPSHRTIPKTSPAALGSLITSTRLPAAQQRRLDQLIDKSKEQALSRRESAELESMLQHIDRKSFWMLAEALASQKTPVPPRRVRGGRHAILK